MRRATLTGRIPAVARRPVCGRRCVSGVAASRHSCRVDVHGELASMSMHGRGESAGTKEAGMNRLISMAERCSAVLLPLILVGLLLGLWHAAVSWSGDSIFPTPYKVLLGILELGRDGALWQHLVASLFRVMIGYGVAVAVGIPLGVLLGWWKPAFAAANPVLQILRPISPIAWIPIAILWFGISDLAPIFLIFLASLFPIATSTIAAVRNIPDAYLDVGRNFGLHGLRLALVVLLPAAMPQIITGLRIGLGIAWLVVVAAEMVAVNSGLGYLIIDARNAGSRYDLVIAGMVLIGLVGLVLDGLVRQLERSESVRWGVGP
jgi:NitT/TauT family transport system permease protein